ncbi:hypothetical protein [Amycolatopsis sp. GM8]|uniref:DUF7144 family membrane protein n=1 Tax=Amycolatopsis sp. GM8 TaxID=2896530 RepID=UPI001F3E8A48|nr:hypothetical protein [Amycolatopsis sp. GM8]
MSDSQAKAHPTGWTGWVSFGGIMLVLLGLFHAVDGLVALLDDNYYAVGPSGMAINVSYTVWGWLHLGLGILAFVVGIGVLSGRAVAQAAAAVIAAASALVHLVFIPAYPFWSIIVIVLDVLIIYALLVHGREITLEE